MVSASDADHGLNAEVHYYLSPEKDYQQFHLDKDTGNLTTRAVLDREVKAVYEVIIIQYRLPTIPPGQGHGQPDHQGCTGQGKSRQCMR